MFESREECQIVRSMAMIMHGEGLQGRHCTVQAGHTRIQGKNKREIINNSYTSSRYMYI